jgi:hypothetical protein
MKSMELLTLLGELAEDTVYESASAGERRRNLGRRRIPRIMAAVCACLLLAVFSVWFFTPGSFDVTENGGLWTVVRVGDRLMFYRNVRESALSPYQRLRLPRKQGEMLDEQGFFTFYRVADRDDLVYILTDWPKGEPVVLEFQEAAYWPDVNLRDTEWYAAGRIDDEDIAALEQMRMPTLGEVLETIYGVRSGEDIRRVRFQKDDADNSSFGKRVRVKAVTTRDAEEISRIYTLLCGMTPRDERQEISFGHVGMHDEAYLKGEAPLSGQVNRDIAVELESGYTLRFTFYPAVGILRQTGTDMLAVLSEEDTAWLIDLAKIDMEWRDWGTEAPHAPAEGDETATVRPPVPESARP